MAEAPIPAASSCRRATMPCCREAKEVIVSSMSGLVMEICGRKEQGSGQWVRSAGYGQETRRTLTMGRKVGLRRAERGERKDENPENAPDNPAGSVFSSNIDEDPERAARPRGHVPDSLRISTRIRKASLFLGRFPVSRPLGTGRAATFASAAACSSHPITFSSMATVAPARTAARIACRHSFTSHPSARQARLQARPPPGAPKSEKRTSHPVR
jgi:hypothetical protein